MNDLHQDHMTRQLLLDRISKIHRFMAKVGSNRVVCTEKNLIHTAWVTDFARSLVTLNQEQGKEFSITSSGAIALHRVRKSKPATKNVALNQAYAAFGQRPLNNMYHNAFDPYGLEVAQVLVTKKSLSSPEGFKNIEATLREIRDEKGVAIINENDTVATEEIRFGDNDTLSAFAAAADGADALILITDVDGFYTANPKNDPSARHIPIIDTVDNDIIIAAAGPIGNHSRGGMETKLEAARIAARFKMDTFIIEGSSASCMADFFNGNAKCTLIRHTAFVHFENELPDRKLKEIISSRQNIDRAIA